MNHTDSGGSVSARTHEKCCRLSQEARSAHVLETAINLFAHKGFQGTKTKEIAEAAGINEALIFRDFQTKEKLYCAILDYAAHRFDAAAWIEELSGLAGSRDDEALFARVAGTLFDRFQREPTLYRLMLYSALEEHELARRFRESQTEPLERFIESYIRSRQGDGVFRDADPHILTRSFLDLCHHHVLRQVLFGQEDGTSAESAAKTVTSVFLDGVRTH